MHVAKSQHEKSHRKQQHPHVLHDSIQPHQTSGSSRVLIWQSHSLQQRTIRRGFRLVHL